MNTTKQTPEETVASLKIDEKTRPEQKTRCCETAEEQPMVGHQFKHIADGALEFAVQNTSLLNRRTGLHQSSS